MSNLRLFAPASHSLSLYAPSDDHPGQKIDDEPVIIPFPRDVTPPRNPRFDEAQDDWSPTMRMNPTTELVDRVRQLRNNRCCPDCGRANVEPVGAARQSGRRLMPIPFAGEIVGFSCGCCGHRWRA